MTCKFFKSILAFFFALLLMAGCAQLGLFRVNAASTSDGLTYTVSDGAATVTGYTGSASILRIPSTLDGASVTAVGDGAFLLNTTLVSLSLPSTLTSIGSNAFAGCANLKEISYIGSTPACVEIGQFAFRSTGWWDAQADGYVSFGYTVLGYKGSAPASLTVGGSFTAIAAQAFSANSLTDAENVLNVHVESPVQSVGDLAFAGLSNLTSLYLSSTAATLGESLTVGCSSDLTLSGYSGSAAQAYAQENSLPFTVVSLSGDYDESGVIDVQDVMMLAQVAVGSAQTDAATDLNGSGGTDVQDVMLLAQEAVS